MATSMFMISRFCTYPTVLSRCKPNDKPDFYSRKSVSRARTDFDTCNRFTGRYRRARMQPCPLTLRLKPDWACLVNFERSLTRSPIFNSSHPFSTSCFARTQMRTLWTRQLPIRTFRYIVGASSGPIATRQRPTGSPTATSVPTVTLCLRASWWTASIYPQQGNEQFKQAVLAGLSSGCLEAGETRISTGTGGSTSISSSPPRQRYKGHRRSPFGAAAFLADFHWNFAGERKAGVLSACRRGRGLGARPGIAATGFVSILDRKWCSPLGLPPICLGR